MASNPLEYRTVLMLPIWQYKFDIVTCHTTTTWTNKMKQISILVIVMLGSSFSNFWSNMEHIVRTIFLLSIFNVNFVYLALTLSIFGHCHACEDYRPTMIHPSSRAYGGGNTTVIDYPDEDSSSSDSDYLLMIALGFVWLGCGWGKSCCRL